MTINETDLTGKVALVTGGSHGIGRSVVLADVDKIIPQKTDKAFQDSGAEVLCVHTDVSKPDQVEKLANETMDTFWAP